jgi:hypothetical protein
MPAGRRRRQDIREIPPESMVPDAAAVEGATHA